MDDAATNQLTSFAKNASDSVSSKLRKVNRIIHFPPKAFCSAKSLFPLFGFHVETPQFYGPRDRGIEWVLRTPDLRRSLVCLCKWSFTCVNQRTKKVNERKITRGIAREKRGITASIIFVIALFLVEEPINRFSDPLQRERESHWLFILSLLLEMQDRV